MMGIRRGFGEDFSEDFGEDLERVLVERVLVERSVSRENRERIFTKLFAKRKKDKISKNVQEL